MTLDDYNKARAVTAWMFTRARDILQLNNKSYIASVDVLGDIVSIAFRRVTDGCAMFDYKTVPVAEFFLTNSEQDSNHNGPAPQNGVGSGVPEEQGSGRSQ